MSDAFLSERDAHYVRDAGFARDARLRRVGRTHRITYHSAAASLITCLQTILLCDIIFKKVVKLLKNICYECYETGFITEKDIYEIAQFVTVKKYNVLYAEELPRFRKQPLKVYALPYDDLPAKAYNGTGRMGLDLGDKQRKKLTDLQKLLSKKFFDDFNYADELMKTESTALQFISLFEESDDFELIWVRNSGTNRAIPEGYEFIGYDISYPCDYSGSFSIICDCMFICRWHGCDKEGILFLPEFSKLNANG